MLKRKKPLKRGGRLKFATSKRAKQLREYSKQRKTFLAKNPRCKECGCLASEVHHFHGRIQSMLNEEEHWLSLCHTCHMKAHHDRRWAVERGLMPKPLWMEAEDLRDS